MNKDSKENTEKLPDNVIVINPPRPETHEEKEAREKREAWVKRQEEARTARQEVLARNNLSDDTRDLTKEDIATRCCS